MDLAVVDIFKKLLVIIVHFLPQLLLQTVNLLVSTLLLPLCTVCLSMHLLYLVMIVVSLICYLSSHLLHLGCQFVDFIITTFLTLTLEKLFGDGSVETARHLGFSWNGRLHLVNLVWSFLIRGLSLVTWKCILLLLFFLELSLFQFSQSAFLLLTLGHCFSDVLKFLFFEVGWLFIVCISLLDIFCSALFCPLFLFKLSLLHLQKFLIFGLQSLILFFNASLLFLFSSSCLLHLLFQLLL